MYHLFLKPKNANIPAMTIPGIIQRLICALIRLLYPNTPTVYCVYTDVLARYSPRKNNNMVAWITFFFLNAPKSIIFRLSDFCLYINATKRTTPIINEPVM